MKLLFFVSLLVLCWASGEEVEDAETLFTNLSDNGLDFDIDDLSFDEVRMKWRLLQELYQVVEEKEDGNDIYVRKRFIGGFFNKTKNAIWRAGHKMKSFFTNQYHRAKASFLNYTSKITFEDVIQKLTPLISSKYTLGACTAACVGASTTVLGPAAPLAAFICGPACKGALSEIEYVVGR